MRSPNPDPAGAYPIAADAEAERTHTSANFSVTWIDDPASPDAPGLRDQNRDQVPDSVRSLLDAFEAARGFLLNQLGYRPPPGEAPMRIYVAARDGRAITEPAPGGSGSSRPSFVVFPSAWLKPPLPPRDLRVVAVHEYFHAIQNGYGIGEEEHWFREASSAWVEGVFDDSLDSTHRYLDDFVPQPRTSLTDVDGDHEYGAFLFVQFLVERYGGGNPGIVRELWEQMVAPESGGPGEGALDALDVVLARRDATFSRAWAEFQLWRWDLERFREGREYLDAVGNEWPKPLQSTAVKEESCRLSSDQGSGLPPLSGDYSVFRPDGPPSANATVTVEGSPGATGFVLVERDSGKQKAQLFEVGTDGLASVRVRFGEKEVKRVVLGVTNPDRSGTFARFGYSLRILGRGAVRVEPLDPPAEAQLFGGLTLRGRVLCNGQPAGSADVALVQGKRSGEQRTLELTTDGAGIWSRTFEPEETSTYHAEVVDPLLSQAVSPPWGVAVRVGLNLEVPDPEVALGEPIIALGEITPSHPGALVEIEYRRPDLSWRAGPQTTAGADGEFRVELTMPAAGIWQIRATVLSTGDENHIGNTTIHDVFVNVR
ncbi:MAG: hypothetical protein ACRDH9_07850 [Actinomycetota bacterium]